MKTAFRFFSSDNASKFYGWPVLAAFFLIAACATPPERSGLPPAGSAYSQAAQPRFNDAEIEKRLRQEYKKWNGVRHQLGGNGGRGIDCSGFVKVVYKDVFNIELPRTTRAQVNQGRPIPLEALQAGDLVFFQPPGYPRHVGIYLGGSEFVHASKSKGVTLSRIDETYWERYYWTARRIIQAGGTPLTP
jgi:cell wall-associated NlpC family hydrolase